MIERPHPFIRREEFPLKEGPVSIIFPDRLSAESLAFVVEWLGLLERKLTRWSAEEDKESLTVQPPAQERPDSKEWWRTIAKQMSARIFFAERALNSIALNHAEPARSGVMQAICALNGEFEKTGDDAARTAPEAQR